MSNVAMASNLLKTLALSFGFITIGACEKVLLPVIDGIDLELQIIAPLSVVQVGKPFSLSIAVKNLGAKAATDVNMVYQIPQNATLLSNSATKGSCQVTTKTITCTVAALESETSAEVSISLKTTVPGVMTNTASVNASEVDAVATNNSSSLIATVEAAPPPKPGSINLPPSGKISWDWQIGASADSNVVVPNGAVLMDVDGFTISANKIASLKSVGIYTVCYINAGSYEDYRPDSSLYPAYLKIFKDVQWNEWFLDVKDVFRPIQPAGTQLVNNKWVDANGKPLVGLPTAGALAPLLEARLKMCADKGFDALEPDNLQNDENAGGLITLQQQIDFNGWLADTAHVHNLAVFQKNGPDKILLKDKTGKMMVEKFDGILNEECQQFNECGPLAEYVKRGKLALNTEYAGTLNCTLSNSLVINSIMKDLNLTGGNMSGYKRQSCN